MLENDSSLGNTELLAILMKKKKSLKINLPCFLCPYRTGSFPQSSLLLHQLSVSCQAAQIPHDLFGAPFAITSITSCGSAPTKPFARVSPSACFALLMLPAPACTLGYVLHSSEGRHNLPFPPGISLNLKGVCLLCRRAKQTKVVHSVEEERFTAASVLVQTRHCTTVFWNGAFIP